MDIAAKLPSMFPAFHNVRALSDAAALAEEAGFSAVTVTDHPFPPTAWARSAEGHHPLEPFIALAVAAASTTRIGLQTGVLVLPYRQAFIVAKSVASLDAISGGRVTLGVATGYLVDEFQALGVRFEDRNELMEEALTALGLAWSGENVCWSSAHHRVPGNQMLPTPAQRPRPRLLVGGNSHQAIDRAIAHADGWAPMGNPARLSERRRTPALETTSDLAGLIEYAQQALVATHRASPFFISYTPVRSWLEQGLRGDGQTLTEDLREWADLGVTQVVVDVPGSNPATWTANLRSAVEALGISASYSITTPTPREGVEA